MGAQPKGLRAFGFPGAPRRANLYYFGYTGFIFTGDHVVTAHTERHPATLLLTPGAETFRIGPPGNLRTERVAAIAPLTTRELRAENTPYISLHIQPRHPAFRAFRGICGSGIRSLTRHRFDHLQPRLSRLHAGTLSLQEANALFEELLALVTSSLPVVARGDRLQRVLDLLESRPRSTLSELAEEVCMSYTGLSHYFSQRLGLSLRSYRLWLKGVRAWEYLRRGASVTEAAEATGFSDAAHFSREWKRWYGMAPSLLQDQRFIRVIGPP